MAATFEGGIFKSMFMNENVHIFIQISLTFVCWGPIDNKSALVQIMPWQHANTWTNVDQDLWHHTTSSCLNELTLRVLNHFWIEVKCNINHNLVIKITHVIHKWALCYQIHDGTCQASGWMAPNICGHKVALLWQQIEILGLQNNFSMWIQAKINTVDCLQHILTPLQGAWLSSTIKTAFTSLYLKQHGQNLSVQQRTNLWQLMGWRWKARGICRNTTILSWWI